MQFLLLETQMLRMTLIILISSASIDLLIRGHSTLFDIFMLFISVRFINYKLGPMLMHSWGIVEAKHWA